MHLEISFGRICYSVNIKNLVNYYLWNTESDAPIPHISGRDLPTKGLRMWNLKSISLTIQKLWPMLKDFEKSKVKVQGHTVKKFGINRKVYVTRNIHVKYESPITYHSMLKFLKSTSNFKVKVRRTKILVPVERACHKEYTCVIRKSYHIPFKSYGQF